MEAMEADGALSPGALERELQAAVAADERQARENEAKLRALRQRVPSYEEFRDIVLASHLKPLEKKDKELDQLPGTSAEFYRDWRRCLKSRKEKYQFLLELGGKALGRIFQADLGFGLLGEFLMVLAENVCHEDRDAILQILESLSGTKRFGLNVDLLSESEKESSRDLFRKLWSMTRNDWTAGHPSSPAGCEPEREAHLTDTSLQKEAEQERMVMDLMKHYQAN
ncbi:coiled-coil domain-containing protein 103 isoform X2 [Falco biarmicus]|uniref:coiled-coil domain-containing protein 103 isoform X2 n=1 Tax=Falco rusticolus TaxID=120794 RepID=UPI000FFBC843|nr:coiled-coil domain-containing protein 103 isoform X2 [Falco rusticolus]XP_056218349.1 coiled-coil domain-containing protein 103 isoform X2 [Falco biarmicus]